jgi:hypothetical protein
LNFVFFFFQFIRPFPFFTFFVCFLLKQLNKIKKAGHVGGVGWGWDFGVQGSISLSYFGFKFSLKKLHATWKGTEKRRMKV